MNAIRRIRLVARTTAAIVTIVLGSSVHANAQTIQGRWIDQRINVVNLEISHVGRTWFVTNPDDRYGIHAFTVLDADDRSIAFRQLQMKGIRGIGWEVVCKLSGADTMICHSTVYGHDTEGLTGGPMTYRRAR